MFPGLLNATATINRSQPVGSNGRSQMAQLYANVPCLLLPMDNHTAIEQKFSIGLAYNAYFNAGQDVKTGDQFSIAGNTYSVKVVQAYNVPIVGYTLALTEQDLT